MEPCVKLLPYAGWLSISRPNVGTLSLPDIVELLGAT